MNLDPDIMAATETLPVIRPGQIIEEILDGAGVLDDEEVCHIADACKSTPGAIVAVCNDEIDVDCAGAKCIECDTCREACGACGRLVCTDCRDLIYEV